MNEFIKCIRYLLKPVRLVNLYRHIKTNSLLKKKYSYAAIGSELHNTDIAEYVWIGEESILSNTSLGRHTYVGGRTKISNCTIGNFCSIAELSQIGFGKHPTDIVSTHPAFYSNNKPFSTFADKNYVEEYGTIEIGNDVWIGARALVMPNVSIGDGAIIAAGSVVTKDIAPYSIVGGVPAKLIRYRFNQDIIDRLIYSQWWNYDEKYFSEHFLDFQDVNVFLQSQSRENKL